MKLSLVAILTSLGTLLAGAPALFSLARPVAQEVPDEGAMRAMMEQAQRFTVRELGIRVETIVETRRHQDAPAAVSSVPTSRR